MFVNKGHCIEIPLDWIRFNPVQPKARTTNDAIKILEDKVRKSGAIAPLTVVPTADPELYFLADGHRRFTVARKLGATHMLVYVLPPGTPLSEAFVDLNVASRTITGRDYLSVYAADQSTLGSFTPKTRANIQTLQSWIGLREIIRIGLEGKIAPAVVNQCLSILGMLNTFPSTAGKVTGGDVFYWITEHGQQRAVIELLADGITQGRSAKMLRAIQGNRPLKKRQAPADVAPEQPEAIM